MAEVAVNDAPLASNRPGRNGRAPECFDCSRRARGNGPGTQRRNSCNRISSGLGDIYAWSPTIQQRLEQERRELEESRAKTLREAETAEEMRRATQERIEQTTSVLAGIRRDAETESERLNQQRAEAAAAAERRRSTTSDLRRLETEREEVTSRVARHQLELTEAGGRIDELTESIE